MNRRPPAESFGARGVLSLLFALLCMGGVAVAHPPVAASAILKIDRSGQVEIIVDHDVLAFALNDTSQNIPDGPMLDLLHAPEQVLELSLQEAAQRFETLCSLTADGVRVPVTIVTYPSVAEVREHKRRRPDYPLPFKRDLYARATLPLASRAVAVRFPEMLGTIVLTVDRPGAEPFALPLQANEWSPAFNVTLSEHGQQSPDPQPASAEDASDGSGWWSVFVRFADLGFDHIIPGGPDHVLFVLGLFLLSPRIKPVLLQISAFTIAHTITLTLTSLNIIGLPASIVEPTIAASVAFVGLENLFTRDNQAWRTGVAFLFGLAHGMGVATAFNEAGFPPGQLVLSLAAFTIGVEAGHLCVLVAAFALIGWTRSRPWFRARVAVPLSLTISAVALFWFFQRLPIW